LSERCHRVFAPSAPLPIGRADNRDCPERKKERANNITVTCPSEHCAEQRQRGEESKVERLGIHSRPHSKGQRLCCPSRASRWPGTAMLQRCPTAGRQAIFLRTAEPRAARPGRNPAARSCILAQACGQQKHRFLPDTHASTTAVNVRITRTPRICLRGSPHG